MTVETKVGKDSTLISWTPEKLNRFKVCYQENITRDIFTFDEQEYVANYARYLIEYLETEFDKRTRA